MVCQWCVTLPYPPRTHLYKSKCQPSANCHDTTLPQSTPLTHPSHTPHTPLTHPYHTPHTPLTHTSITPRSHLDHTSITPRSHPSHTPYTPLTHPSHTPHTPLTHPIQTLSYSHVHRAEQCSLWAMSRRLWLYLKLCQSAMWYWQTQPGRR